MAKEYGFFIGGKWRKSGKLLDVVYPHDGKLIARVHLAQEKDIQDALDAADKAFAVTRKALAWERSDWCRKIMEGLAKRKDELTKTLALEAGKPWQNAATEVDRAIGTFGCAAEEAHRLQGELVPMDTTKASGKRFGIARRFPIGVISGITPFNFPLNLACHKLAPALASGNTMVLKPASKTPLTALLLAEIVEEAGIPAGAFNVVPCNSKLAGPLIEDERVKMVSFTGSDAVGWDLKKRAANKKVALELGGDAAVIIEPDADLDVAAKKCVPASFSYSGQSCISIQRLFVHERVREAFTEKFLKHTKALKTGEPLQKDTEFSCMIDEENAKRIEEWVEEARGLGAKILCGGHRKGAYYEPTVLTGVPKKTRLGCREAFGPIVILIPYADFDKVLKEANNSAFGLQAGLFTRDLNKIMKAFEELEVGGLMVNETSTFRVDNMPYGGIKRSGVGREGLKYAIEEMTELKLLGINLN